MFNGGVIMDTYSSTISFWDSVFNEVQPKYYAGENKIHEDLETAIKWISDGSKSILDYGCGSGAMLFRGAVCENIDKCLGVDISLNAVELGNATAKLNKLDNIVESFSGGVEVFYQEDEIVKLFNRADHKLYYAKHTGKKKIVFDIDV